MKIKIENIEKFERAFAMAPSLVVKEMNKAMRASLAEIMKREIDEYFQFKTPRAKRTGMLQRMFQLNTATAMKSLVRHGNKWRVEVKSTVRYAERVVRLGNPYYDRIAMASWNDVQKHWERSLEIIMNKLAKKLV